MLSEHLWYEIVSIWWLKRKLAWDMGLTILEFDKIWRENPEKAKEYDLKYEEYQKSLPLESKVILDSKMSFHCQPKSFKVFMAVSDEEWAKRVFEQQRTSDERKSYESVLAYNKERHQWWVENYKKLYDVNIFDMNHYTLVIDTSTITPQQAFEKIINAFTIFTQQS